MGMSNMGVRNSSIKSRVASKRGTMRPMNIGAVAEMAGLPAKKIRYYEEIGLIHKAARLPNGYRAYSAVETRELNFIKRARGLGFSIEEVRDLLDLWRDKTRPSRAVRAMAAIHLEALDRKIAELESMRRTLAQLVNHCLGDKRPECPILEELDEGGRTTVRRTRR